MPIQATPSDEKLTIELTNGERRALDEIREEWRFKDVGSVLEFALAILHKKKVQFYIDQSDGTKTKVFPNPNLLQGGTSSNS